MGSYLVLKRIDSNTYELAIAHNFRINLVFNIENLTPCRTIFDYPTVIPDLPSLASPRHQHFIIRTPPPSAFRKYHLDEITDIVVDEIVLTVDGKYQHYLMRWRGCPDSNCTWLHIEKIQRLDLD